MKLLICSDSHGLTNELCELKRIHSDVDYFIHCGDSELSKTDPAVQGFHIVKGNCDFGNDFPNELIVEAGTERIFVTHGHLNNVKSSLMNLHYKAIENNAQIVCFGHTHILGYEIINDILFINPGSIRLPRMRKEKTYILLEINNENRVIHTYEFGKGEIITETL